MALSSRHQQLAERFGVTKPPEQSEAAFSLWLERLSQHIGLINEAKGLGVTIRFGMKSKELRQAINDRLRALLKEQGFNPNAKVRFNQKIIEIREITVKRGRDAELIVKYWIVEPWTRTNNRGRATYIDAKTVLKKGKLVS